MKIILLFLSISFLNASTVKLMEPYVIVKETDDVRVYDENQKKYVDKEGWKYTVILNILNQSDQTHTFITTGLGSGYQKEDGILNIEIRYDEMTKDDYPVIPSVTDLRLVELRKGEVTAIEPVKYKSIEKLKSIIITYTISEKIAKRFDAWSGELKLEHHLKK